MASVDEPALRAAYDGFRRTVSFPDAQRVEAGAVVLHLSPSGDGAILYSDLNEETADAAIRDQIEEARIRQAAMEWVAYSHDTPPDLPQRLEAHGFTATGSETILVLDLDHLYVPADTTGLDVRRVTSPDEVAAIAAIQQQIWGGDAGNIAERLARRLAEAPDSIGLFAAFVDGRLVSTAQITYYPEQRFASLVRSATLPAYRRRGLYTALVAARIADAQDRGIHYLDTEASPLSRPILERFGFRPIAEATTYVWEPS